MSRKPFPYFLLTLTLFCFFISINISFAQSQAVEYLCSYGIRYYEKGLYDDALTKFKEVLLLEPENKTAKKYINEIFTKSESPQLKPSEATPRAKPVTAMPAQSQFPQQTKITPDRQRAMDNALSYFESPPKQVAIAKNPEKETEEEAKINVGPARITGEIQARGGVTSSGDAYWKRANWDLNEKNWRQLDYKGLNQGINTYDPRIYDRLSVNVDSGKETGFGIHSNLVVDPWSFTGKSDKILVNSAFGDTAVIQYKYWSNNGYTLNEAIQSTNFGNSFILPEVRVRDEKTGAISVPGAFTFPATDTFFIPETKIHRNFMPVREFWVDYNKEDKLKLRVYPMGYENQSITFDDPLVLSNNHIWWEDSPWIHAWKHGTYNPGGAPTADFTKGYWDNELSFQVRDSEGRRLTALRGIAFDFSPFEKTSINTNISSPKSLWQDYDDLDNVLTATRLNQGILDNLKLGVTATTRVGYNVDDDHKEDAQNYVLAGDLRFEIMEGVMASLEVAASRSKYDITSPGYETKERGNAYYFSLIGRFPSAPVIDTKFGYNGIQPEEGESSFTKFRFFVSRMDKSFDQPLSSYVETRDDEYWSRHIHFRKPFKYYYQGEGQLLSWDDIKVDRIGNGIDIDRSTFGLRVESLLFDKKIDNLFDARNVHATDGKFVENVLRDELTWTITDKLTGKFLGIYNRLPHTKAGVDPFVFNPRTREYFLNTKPDGTPWILDGKDPSIATGSLGLNYDFFDWLGLNGIWEYTNDISLGYDNFPRGIYNGANLGNTYYQNGNKYREILNFLYNQQYFPTPPYPYYNIFKTGLRISPIENLEFYVDYTRNSYEKAGPIDDNMNHVGLTVTYSPLPKLSMMFKYNYSRWQDIDKLAAGITKVFGHNNIFTELIYRLSEDQDFTFQYGEGSRDPYMGGVLDITWDPYGGDLRTVDTQHIFRMYYRRKF